MKNDAKMRDQLVQELTELRSQNVALEKSITGYKSARLIVEEALRYAENIVETVREPLLVLDADLKIISANRNFYRTFKVTPCKTIGSFIYDLGNKQWGIPKLRELLEEVLPAKEVFDDFEVEHDFQDIGHKIMLLNARQIYRKDIGAKMILLAIEDITEHKRLENILTESEELYRGVFRTASDGILLLEKREGKIIHTNPAAEKMLGYTNKECIGNKLQNIGFMLDMGDFQTTMQDLNKNGIINYTDVPVTTKSGQHMDADIYLVDKTKVVQCNIRDTTDRKRAEAALLESEEKVRSYIERAPDGVFIIDDAGRYIEVNKSACRITGYSKEEIEKMSIRDLLAEESLEDGLAHFKKLVETGAATSDLWHKQKHGSKRCLTVNAVKLSETRILGFCKDITERKEAEKSLKDTLGTLRKAFGTVIQVLVTAVESRDPYTAGHQSRSAALARAIAAEMGLSQNRIDGIRMAGSIHDIGKMSVPVEMLIKPTKLSELEFSLIKEHAHKGFEMLKDVESPWPLAEIVHQHHERMDGSGYPRQLKGEDIIIEARILAVADVVESMASHRPYRPALGLNAALAEIENNKGTLYDADAVDACLRLFREKGYQLDLR